MLAVEINLSNTDTLKAILVIALFSISSYYLIWPYFLSLFKNIRVPSFDDTLKREESGRSSDTPPPEGFAEHLAIIEKTAPNANTEVWWEYAKKELTEAEVAIAEAKLARKPGSAKENSKTKGA